MAHSENSASDSGRWSRCFGSLRATRHIKEDRSSVFAAEGSVAHTVRAQCLDFGFDALDFVDSVFKQDGMEFTVTDEMADNIQPGIDECREYEGQMFVEKWVDTTAIVGLDTKGNRQGSTLDLGIAGQKLIVISDLKYGMGVPVQAFDNDQQVIYAWSFWDQIARHITDADQFLIIIDQPRNPGGGGRWRLSLAELQERVEKLRIAAEKTRDPNAPLVPGEKQCLWCPIANMPGRIGGCAAHHDWIAETIDAKFDRIESLNEVGMDWTPPQNISREVRSHIVRMKSSIEKWLEKLHADELSDLISHGPACGFKAVDGRAGRRVHRDEVKSLAYIKARLKEKGKSEDEAFTKKLISPSQGEKLLRLGTNNFPRSLIDQGAPKPVMVPVEDDRPSISVEDKFDEV